MFLFMRKPFIMNATDFDPIESLNFLTNRVGRLLTSRLKVLLKRSDFEIPTQCASILADLWKQDGLKQQDLAIAAIKDKATIARALNLMEKHNVIVRRIDEKDKRKKKIFLTYKGVELQQRIWLTSIELGKEATQGISKEEVEICKKVLKSMYNSLKK